MKKRLNINVIDIDARGLAGTDQIVLVHIDETKEAYLLLGFYMMKANMEGKFTRCSLD